MLSNKELPKNILNSVRLISALIMLLGVSVVCGWQWDIQVLKSMFPGLTNMMPNAALNFVLTGLVLYLQTFQEARGAILWIRRSGIVLMLLIGLTTLGEYLFDWDAGIDQLLFQVSASDQVQSTFPGRYSIYTAVSFVLLGCAISLTELKRHWVLLQSLAVTACLIALWQGIKYLYLNLMAIDIYGVNVIPSNGKFSPYIAIHETLGIMLVGASLLINTYSEGFVPRLQKKIPVLSVGTALILLFLSCSVVLYGLKQSRTATGWVEHTYEVVNHLDALALNLQTFSGELRGFLADDQDSHVLEAERLRGFAQVEIDKFRQLTNDNPDQKRRLDALAPLLEQRYATADKLVKIRREQSLADALIAPANLESLQLATEISKRLEELKAAELSLLTVRKQTAVNKDTLASSTVMISTVISVLLLFGAILALRREITQHIESESRLRAFFNTSAIGIVVIDAKGGIEEFNQASSEMFGWRREEIYRAKHQGVNA